MGKLTIEQAKKMMEAAKNAETNPADDKFYPDNKVTTADKIDTGLPRPLPDKKKKKMPAAITGKVKTLLFKPNDPNRETKLEKPLFKPNDPNRKTGLQFVNRKSGSKKAEKKKMPKARDMAMGDKNIVYLGDPYMVDGKMFDPVKKNPKDYLRPEGAKTYSKGSKKPIKAVAGVLAGLAAGVAPGVIGLGYLAKKKMKKTSAVAEPNDDKYSMNNKKPIMDLYQKTVKQKTANMYTGGEVEVTKGGDYIKDLID